MRWPATPVPETGLVDMEHRSLYLEDSDTVELNHEMFEIDAVIFDELKSRKLKLVSKKSGKGIEMEYKDFPYLILWSSANHGNFVAIEPWTGLSTCSDEGDLAICPYFLKSGGIIMKIDIKERTI